MTISTSPALDETASRLDAAAVRADFPIFDVEVYDLSLIHI